MLAGERRIRSKDKIRRKKPWMHGRKRKHERKSILQGWLCHLNRTPERGEVHFDE